MGLSGARIGDIIILVGVVFRGSLWLDGIVTASLPAGQSYSVAISRMVRASKQFSQLHVVIISPLLVVQARLPISKLARSMKMPVIAVTRPTKDSNSNRSTRGRSLTIAINRTKRVIVFTGTSREQAQQLYRIACGSENILPESVRVADMLAKEFRSRTKSAENMTSTNAKSVKCR